MFNGGSEWQDEFGLNWYSTMNRSYDPALGRFFGIDALSDLMPSISPTAFAYNNPILFNDPLGLAGVPGCDECNGTVLDEVIVTASRLPQIDYSWLLNSYNPVYRNIGMKAQQGDTDYLRHAFNQSPIQYGEGLGYQTQFMRGMNTIGSGVTSGLIYASFGVMAAPVVIYGSPYLFKGLSIADRFTGGAITSAGVEGVSQGIVNVAQRGFTMEALEATDLADIGFAALNKNFVITSALGASINFTIGDQTLTGAENLRTFSRDFTVGLIGGGQYKGLQKMEISKFWKEVFNGFNTLKAKGLGAASDQIAKE